MTTTPLTNQITRKEIADFWESMPPRHRECVMFSVPPDERKDAFIEGVTSAPIAGISRTSLAWAQAIQPNAPTAAIHIATNTTKAPLVHEAKDFLKRAHELFPWLVCAIPTCFIGAINTALACRFTPLCVIPGSACFARTNRFHSMRLLIHGQKA